MSFKKDLKLQLERFQRDLDALHKSRRQQRLQLTRDLENEAPTNNLLRAFSPSTDVVGLLETIQRAVRRDRDRYVQTGRGTVPVRTAEPAAAVVEAAEPDTVAKTPAQAVAGFQAGFQAGPFTQPVLEHLQPWLTPPLGGLKTAHLPDGAAVFAALLEAELADLTGANALQGSAGPILVTKLKQVQMALEAQRYSDCVTLLKTIQQNDPHNHMVLFLLGQILYYLTGQGQQGALPEARDFSQRSLIFSEKVSAAKLWLYRYHAAVSELAYEPERALVWLRDSGLLNPTLLQTMSAHTDWAFHGVGLMGWAVLAEIPAALWTDSELAAMHALVEDATGGGLLYLQWFRQPLIEEAAKRKAPLPHVEDIEKRLQMAWRLYTDIATPLQQLSAAGQQAPWIVRMRYLMTLTQLAPIPHFDQVLLNIALSGEMWRNSSLDGGLRSLLEDFTSSYWRLWSLSITPNRERRQMHLMPAHESVEDIPELEKAKTLMETLRAAEKERIKADVWQEVQPWLVRWELDHLLAAGSGSNQPRLRFAPSLPPYSGLYRQWSEPPPKNALSSEVIMENAGRGGFASMFEILSAFEGAYRLLDDPAHGLVATQRRALAQAKKQQPEKFGGMSMEVADKGRAMLLLALPVVLLGGIGLIFQLADNLGQAIGLTLALAGVGGIVAVRLLAGDE